MSSPSEQTSRQKIISSADLLRRGATLLGEACPRCSGVQIRYQGKTYCLNEDDLSSILSPEPATPTSQPKQVSTESSVGLRKILEEKLSTVSKQLETSQDPDEQAKLLELISKYVDTLDKLKKTSL